jgi:hypothetical protein
MIYYALVIIFLFLGYVIYALCKCHAINTIAKTTSLSDRKAKYICDIATSIKRPKKLEV